MDNSIVQLLISMVVTYDDYGDKIGYTKEELDNLIKKYKLIENGKWNELGTIELYNNNYITKERFCKDLELEYDDGNFWMVFDNFDDILPSNFDIEADILNGQIERHWQSSGFYDYDFNISDFNNVVLNEIVNFCIRNKCSIEVNDEELIITKNNIRISGNEIYIGKEKLNDHINDDGMEELKQKIQFAIEEAYDMAEMNEVYKICKKSFEKGYGEFKWKNKNGKENKLFVKLEVDLLTITSRLENVYTFLDIISYSQDDYSFGNMYHVLNELELIGMDNLNYNYNLSYPSSKELNSSVIERLIE